MTSASIGETGQNLIFIVSQGGSGSTLLQRVLDAHPDVITRGETHIMDYALHSFAHHNLELGYGTARNYSGFHQFIKHLDEKEDVLYTSLRKMAHSLYQKAMDDSGAKLFVDKGTEYPLVLPEIFRTFPDAKYIILLRSPIAVFSSIVDRFYGDNWLYFKHAGGYNFTHNPYCIIDGLQKLGSNVLVIHYEKFVQNPETEAKRICDYVGIEFDPLMVNYGKTPEFERFVAGSHHNLRANQRPNQHSIDKWIDSLKHSSQKWRFAKEYLESLGPEIVEQLGYSYSEILSQFPPSPKSNKLTVSWESFMSPNLSTIKRLRFKAVFEIQRRGWIGTWLHMVKYLFHLVP